MPRVRKTKERTEDPYALGTVLTTTDVKAAALVASGAWEAGEIIDGEWVPAVVEKVKAAKPDANKMLSPEGTK